MAKKLISFDDSKTGDAALPEPVKEVLRATYVRGVVSPYMRPLRAALDAGRSTAILCIGDSTVDSFGRGTDYCWPERFGQRIAAAYPNHRVVSRMWDTAIDDYGADVVLQAGSGPRYAQVSSRGLGRFTATPPAFSSGNLDLRIKVAPDTWTPAADQELISRGYKIVSGSDSSHFQFDWALRATGKMILKLGNTDGTPWAAQIESSVAVTGTAGQAQWLRVTCEIVAGTSRATKFYTSSDGAAWTQVGTTISHTGAIPALPAEVAGHYFTAGSTRWQPASQALLGKIYEIQVRDGVNGPMLTPASVELWQRYPDATTTFGGSPTVTILNAGRAGTNMSWHTDPARQKRESAQYGQTLTIFSDSHNESGRSGPVDWIAPFEAWVASVRAALTGTSVGVVMQNPHLASWPNEAAYGYSHLTRMDELRHMAAKNGWEVFDFYGAFMANPNWQTQYMADSLHPNSTGQEVSADVLARALGIKV
ncbi:SGNH/GDSL hydrolase family protein [Rhodococcus aetherivorans]|uniref:SGNH/GDSL hydrolase family protein n=1 Tax=Rhodococcus aetherivorans TaxID=191292 RepID=UPI0002D22880|nr:SGNH/GDSL hydrolase family protein [Rhodococcus aetherivorans]CCW14585.1 hypothetical protein EBESD8_51550 [Rhodococcus aetherivorans]